VAVRRDETQFACPVGDVEPKVVDPRSVGTAVEALEELIDVALRCCSPVTEADPGPDDREPIKELWVAGLSGTSRPSSGSRTYSSPTICRWCATSRGGSP